MSLLYSTNTNQNQYFFPKIRKFSLPYVLFPSNLEYTSLKVHQSHSQYQHSCNDHNAYHLIKNVQELRRLNRGLARASMDQFFIYE